MADVRRIRERLDREAGGGIHVLVEQSNKAFEQYRRKLGLKLAGPTDAPPTKRKGRTPYRGKG